MAPSRRKSNGRSPLVNQQRQITSFFSKSASPSPIPSNSNHKPNPNPSPSPATPSPRNPKPHKPLLLITPPSLLYGDDVVGRRIKVYWPLDKAWYEGSVKSFDNIASKHLVQYDDGEEESLDLAKEKIEWPQHSTANKLKRLRKMVIEDVGDDDDDDDDDSGDEDWGKNAVGEDNGEEEEEEDMELEDEEKEEDDVAKRSARKASGKVESRKRKLGGGTEKMEPAKKSKSGGDVQLAKGSFKVSVLEPTTNLDSK